MTRYKLILDNGHKKIVNASSPKKAIGKFLSSNYHFNTEAYVEKVVVDKAKPRRVIKRSSSLNSLKDLLN